MDPILWEKKRTSTAVIQHVPCKQRKSCKYTAVNLPSAPWSIHERAKMHVILHRGKVTVKSRP